MSRSPSPTDISGAKVPKFNNGWTKAQEELMAGWADIAACYRWMHDRCEKIMAKKNMMITVPVIILSTLTGSANFITSSLVGDDAQLSKYTQIGIGGVSIFTGILTTLGNFFRYAQNSEANRVASIAWGKFQRQLAVELALHPKDRIDCMDFLKICRAELDRMIEQSPPIPDIVIKAFELEFQNIPDLKRPDIAHGMDHTKVFVDKDTRLKQMAADAAIMIKQKRKVWHNAMMPDVEHHVDKRMKSLLEEISTNHISTLKDKINELEKAIQEKEKESEEHVKKTQMSHYKSFMNNKGPQHHFPVTGKPQRRLSMPMRKPTLPLTPLNEKTLEHTIPSFVETSHEDLIDALQKASSSNINEVRVNVEDDTNHKV